MGNDIGMDGKYSPHHPHPSLATSLDIVTQVISKFISELKFNLVLSYYGPHIMLNFHILGEIRTLYHEYKSNSCFVSEKLNLM